MSSQPRPAFASARSHACGLPCSIRYGSTPASPNETNRARGSSPSRDAVASLATSTPAAPSQIWLELPAVTTPSGRNAGFSAASASSDVSRRGVSSTANSTPTCGFETSTGTISLLEAALVDRRDRAPVRLERVLVELLAREAPLLGDHLGRDALRHDLPALEQLRPRGRRRSSPSARATSSRRPPRRRGRAGPTRSRRPR